MTKKGRNNKQISIWFPKEINFLFHVEKENKTTFLKVVDDILKYAILTSGLFWAKGT